MNAVQKFTLSGVARPKDVMHMLDEICEHFIEHAEVERNNDLALLISPFGTVSIRRDNTQLLIDISCPSELSLEMTRTSLAEHMFYFAGEDPLELSWAEPVSDTRLPNIHEVIVASVENVTPYMRRVKFACADVTPFIGGDIHVRILVPPKGRQPVWPGYRADGRVAWPEGEDELLVRVYTIRAVDAERRELWIDFLQHPLSDIKTPGADFARDCQPGDRLALLGPGGGGVPQMDHILMVGDESAIPAIARIAAEVPAGTRMQVIIEVKDASEEQPLPTVASLEIRWLHRKDYPVGAQCVLAEAAKTAITATTSEGFVWFAGEKQDVRSVRAFLKSRKHNPKAKYVAWYWEQS